MKIIWFVSSLEQKGGGERFVLEAVKAICKEEIDAKIVCDRINAAASFDGQYDLSKVICNNQKTATKGYLSEVFTKAKGLTSLYKTIKNEKPDLVICQSEFDAIKLYILSYIHKFEYRVFIFGQMFQFKHDISKYSIVFRNHLKTIRDSRPGYQKTVTIPPPKISFPSRLVNEVISLLKFQAIKNANRIFTLSEQVKWEVEILYNRKAEVCRAAYNENYIDLEALKTPKPLKKPIRILSVSRLADKKRIDLIINAFSITHKQLELIIIGIGPEEKKLKKIASQSPKKDSIKFLGSVSDEQLERERSKADCFISMDIGDFDISVIEAMGKALRVIVPTDFDLTGVNTEYAGILSVEPTKSNLSLAMDSIDKIPSPSIKNLLFLKKLTWQHLAKKCTAT